MTAAARAGPPVAMEPFSFQLLAISQGAGFALGDPSVRATTVPPSEATLRLRDPFRCVVLIPRDRLPRARELARILPLRRRRVLVVSSDPHDLEAWRDRVACRWIPPAEVLRAVQEAREVWRAGQLRYPIGWECWFHRTRDSDPCLRRALRKVAALRSPHDVEEWARASDMHRTSLWRHWTDAAGCAPSEILLEYVAAQVHMGPRAGLGGSRGDARLLQRCKPPASARGGERS